MSVNIINSYSSKNSSLHLTNSRASSASKPRVSNPRRVVPSRKITQTSNNRKALSTGLLYNSKVTVKSKKTTKSDNSVSKHAQNFDYCTNCGDVLPAKSMETINSGKESKNDSRLKLKSQKTAKPKEKTKNYQAVRQHYKNQNYRSNDSTEDISNGVKKISLRAIEEVSEMPRPDSIFKIYPEDDDVTFFDVDDKGSLEELKEFRQKNYFECHSAKSRIKNRGSAINLQGHTCVYRFYLNDRLFPVPLSTDHNNQVRCVECHLPMGLNISEATKINGTIQAKVTIGNKNQDIMLLLPVKEPLIITEKRKEERKDTDVVFFGVINLDNFGSSMFGSAAPTDSMALRYQRGYRAFCNEEDYTYRDIEKNDVIVI